MHLSRYQLIPFFKPPVCYPPSARFSMTVLLPPWAKPSRKMTPPPETILDGPIATTRTGSCSSCHYHFRNA